MRPFNITKSQALTASASTENILAGTKLAPAVANGTVSLYATASVADDVTVDLAVGTEDILKKSLVSAINAFPKMNEDHIVTVPVSQGEQVLLEVHNANAGVQSFVYKLAFTPAGMQRRRR